MKQPLISILVQPTVTLRERAVTGLLGQSYPNWELLVAGEDHGLSWTPWAAIDRRIRRLPPTDGRSRGAALNALARHARGEWIGYFDSHVELHPEFLDRAVAACASCSSALIEGDGHRQARPVCEAIQPAPEPVPVFQQPADVIVSGFDVTLHDVPGGPVS
jgi:glycosyltransferase involved in cell wall biosynthesis